MSEHDERKANSAEKTRGLDPVTATPGVLSRTPTPTHQRLKPFPKSVFLPEQIVGSSHEFVIVRPEGAEHATAMVVPRPYEAPVSRMEDPFGLPERTSEDRAEAFSAASTHYSTMAPIPIRFWPKTPGNHEAAIRLVLTWPDGVVDERIVNVFARARRLEDVPSNPIEDFQTEGPTLARVPRGVQGTADLEQVPEVHKTSLSNEFDGAQLALAKVHRLQGEGLGLAKTHALSYQYQSPKPGLVSQLAELALVAAVGGIAGLAARAAAATFAPKLVSLLPKPSTPRGIELLHKYSEGFISDTVKDGFKHAVKGPLVKAVFGPDSPKVHGGESRPSPDPALNFFALQTRALIQLQAEVEQELAAQYRDFQHDLLTKPDVPIAALQSMKVGYSKAAEGAAEEQQRHAEHQWVSLVARSDHGAERVEVDGRRGETTKLEGLVAPKRGLLVIDVELDAKGIFRRVTGARMMGVSQELADRLSWEDLREAAVPLMFVTRNGTGGGVLTRDEVGRVRQYALTREDEIDAHRGAEEIVAKALERTLSAWRVRVETDDTTTYVLQPSKSEDS